MIEPNAPDPALMREEMVNDVVAKSFYRINRGMAEKVVNAILERQMRFYSQFASPELEADSVEQMQVVSEVMGVVEALIRQGATMVEHMLPEDRVKWQRTAQRGRDLVVRMARMFS